MAEYLTHQPRHDQSGKVGHANQSKQRDQRFSGNGGPMRIGLAGEQRQQNENQDDDDILDQQDSGCQRPGRCVGLTAIAQRFEDDGGAAERDGNTGDERGGPGERQRESQEDRR